MIVAELTEENPMRHVRKYLSLYERLCSSVIILCALLLGGISIYTYDGSHEASSRYGALLFFLVLLIAIAIKLWLHDLGTKAIRQGKKVG